MRRCAPEQLDALLVVDSGCELGESPVWDVTTGHLVWVDITGRRIHRYRPADSSTSYDLLPLPVGSVSLTSTGGLLLALANGFWLMGPGTEPLRPFRLVELAPQATRFNDGKCDSSGRFWAGSVAAAGNPCGGALFRLDSAGDLVRVLSEVTISNGLGWSPDDSVMYFVDSPTRQIDAFSYDSRDGSIGARRCLLRLPPDQVGVPDGLAVDADNGVWVAIWNGSAVHRYTADGRLDVVIRVPVSRVTSCAFGGTDLEDLYITTASYGSAPGHVQRERHAGGVFVARPGRRGLPVNRFAVEASGPERES